MGPLALVTQLGFTVVTALVLSLLLGLWLDSQFGTSPLMTLVFSMFGVLIGTIGMYRLVARAIAESAATRPLPGPSARTPVSDDAPGKSERDEDDPWSDDEEDEWADDKAHDKDDDWYRDPWRDDDASAAEQRRKRQGEAERRLRAKPPSANPIKSEEEQQ